MGGPQFIKHVRFGQPLQGAGRSTVFRVGGDFFLFSFTQLLKISAPGAEAQLAIEPERAGVDGFIVVLSDLVRINRDAFGTGEGAEAAQSLGVDPGGFSLAIGVESVEADLDPFAESDGFDVVDRDAILQSVAGRGKRGAEDGGRVEIPRNA